MGREALTSSNHRMSAAPAPGKFLPAGANAPAGRVRTSYTGEPSMNIKRGVPLACMWWVLGVAANPSFAADPEPAVLTEQEKQQANELDKETLLANKEAAAIAAKTALAKAKVDAATPATGEGVTGPSGAVTGANNMTFAMYMVSLESLKRVAQAVCKDLAANGITDVYMTSKDVAEAVAKDAALTRGRMQLADKLSSVTLEVGRMKAGMAKPVPAPPGTAASAAPRISAASLTAVASGIDIAAGLVKGAAGLASLFKSERTIAGSDNLLTAAEVSSSLSMCSADKTAGAAPRVRNVDADLTALTARITSLSNETKDVSTRAAALEKALTELATAAADLEKERKEAGTDKAKLAALNARAKPANHDAFTKKAAELVATAETYVDAFHRVDAATGLSPLIVAAQFRVVQEAAMDPAVKKGRLVLTLLKSNGYSLTTKRLFLNDRVDFAGGVAIRAAVLDDSGAAVYERIFFRESGWIRADFHSSGDAIVRQNF